MTSVPTRCAMNGLGPRSRRPNQGRVKTALFKSGVVLSDLPRKRGGRHSESRSGTR